MYNIFPAMKYCMNACNFCGCIMQRQISLWLETLIAGTLCSIGVIKFAIKYIVVWHANK